MAEATGNTAQVTTTMCTCAFAQRLEAAAHNQ